MQPPVEAAVIAGSVALVGAALSAWYNHRVLRDARLKSERELQRRFTERLLDLRLKVYPRAFEITETLEGEFVFAPSFGSADAAAVRERLTEWNRAEAPLVVSEDVLRAFRDLRDSLGRAARLDGPFPEKLRREIWVAKNHFRFCLRADVQLLYKEDDGEAAKMSKWSPTQRQATLARVEQRYPPPASPTPQVKSP
jgi:hypothetical protein